MACPLLGDGITDNTLLHIASFLPTARDLLCLQLACPRFAAKVIAHGEGGGAAAAAAPEMLCIAEEAARLWLAGCSDQERGWAPRRELETQLGLMHELELLRVPLAFGRAHADLTLVENGAVARKSVDGDCQTAATKVVMRSGRHFAQFTTYPARGGILFGVIRPGWDVEGREYAELVAAHAETDGHCFLDTIDGARFSGDISWEGMQGARGQGERISMLLDLDQASMTVWKNGVKLRVMVVEG